MQEKFDVDVSSRDVVEFDITDDKHCTMIIYNLKTPIDVFGKDSGDNPLPTVDSICVTSYTTDLVPVAFDIEMTEDEETNDYYSKEVYAGFRRSDIVHGTVEDVINCSYEQDIRFMMNMVIVGTFRKKALLFIPHIKRLQEPIKREISNIE